MNIHCLTKNAQHIFTKTLETLRAHIDAWCEVSEVQPGERSAQRFKSFGKDMLYIFIEIVCNKFKTFSGLNVIY